MEEEKKELTEVEDIEEVEEKEGYHFPWSILVIVGIFLVLMIVCIIVIYANGGPTKE